MNNLKFLIILFLTCQTFALKAQKWLDTIYQIKTTFDIKYGSDVDFAGNVRDLYLDVSEPIGDTTPNCGRPLIIIIHGGAFMAGDKSESSIIKLRELFAKRGYTSVSVNYRLGLFQTSSYINCNVSNLGVEWNCLNMTDTAEWYRAYFRGIQDVNGAVRFLVNQSNQYKIDVNNIFICGESAGAFIAMGVGYIDDSTEVNQTLTSKINTVSAPNSLYELKCIQGYGLDTSIASMRLTRPNLGSYQGKLNHPAIHPYTIRAVGNLYGAVFDNIFTVHNQNNPGLYLFHQPNDLIVPFSKNQIFSGFALCATQFPFSCQYIINRPFVYGSSAIQSMFQEMQTKMLKIPDYSIDFTTNNANCAMQIANPSLSGHAYDNFGLRTKHMAFYFKTKIDSCQSVSIPLNILKNSKFHIYPNPISKDGHLIIEGGLKKNTHINLFSVEGYLISKSLVNESNESQEIHLKTLDLKPGIYFLNIITNSNESTYKVIVID